MCRQGQKMCILKASGQQNGEAGEARPQSLQLGGGGGGRVWGVASGPQATHALNDLVVLTALLPGLVQKALLVGGPLGTQGRGRGSAGPSPCWQPWPPSSLPPYSPPSCL